MSPDGRWIVYVHHAEGVDGLALVDSDGALFPRKLAYGTDFVMQPAWHPDGTMVAYVAWNQPQMPWDGSLLQLAHLKRDADGVPTLDRVETLAGDTQTSLFQPEFSPDGRTLAYASDKTGWWQLYLYDLASGTHTQLTDADAEDAAPAWAQGARTFAWSHDGAAIYFIRNQAGRSACGAAKSAIVSCGASRRSIITAICGRSRRRRCVAKSRCWRRRAPSRIASSRMRLNMRLWRQSHSHSQRDADHQRDRRRRPRRRMGAPAQRLGDADDALRRRRSDLVDGARWRPGLRAVLRADQPRFREHGRSPADRQGARRSHQPDAHEFLGRGAVLHVARLRLPRSQPSRQPGYGKAYRDKLLHAWGSYDVEDSASGAQHLVDQGWRMGGGW
ncbi:MAG: hypothetical protein U0703_24610 [Anaerolineae bacterium]